VTITVTGEGGAQVMTVGSTLPLSAAVTSRNGTKLSTPVTWASSNTIIATVNQSGLVQALAVGATEIRASAGGLTSDLVALSIRSAPAAVMQATILPPTLVSPGELIGDSVQVVVATANGVNVNGAKVVFRVTAGGGRLLSPDTVLTERARAATRWVAGDTGVQTLTASLIVPPGDPAVQGNPVTFTSRAARLTTIVAGDHQTGLLLSDLPVRPSVRVLNEQGQPRPGVPVTFTVTSGNGRIEVAQPTTDVNGVATAGTWTLGDLPGTQTLIAQAQSSPPVTLTAVATGTPVYLTATSLGVAIARTCASTNSAELYCWGANIGGRPTLVGGSTPRLTNIVTNGGVACGLAQDGQAWCWGGNQIGEFGLGSTSTGSTIPVPSAGSIRFTEITIGQQGSHVCGVATDSVGYCWGGNESGQLGIGTKSSAVPTPISVAGGFRWKHIAAEEFHTCGITTTGLTMCWGGNTYGQLGDGTQVERLTPVAVNTPVPLTSVDVGVLHSCGLAADGRAFCWGRGDFGYLGDGHSRSVSTTPVKVESQVPFMELSAGWNHSCARDGQGAVYCWGVNDGTFLGTGSTAVAEWLPAPVRTDLRFSTIRAGQSSRCGLVSTTGAVACWGANNYGQLGRGYASPSGSTPQRIVLRVDP
jgi:alpha-tubulin suppressor-like RCC1 family protein